MLMVDIDDDIGEDLSEEEKDQLQSLISASSKKPEQSFERYDSTLLMAVISTGKTHKRGIC